MGKSFVQDESLGESMGNTGKGLESAERIRPGGRTNALAMCGRQAGCTIGGGILEGTRENSGLGSTPREPGRQVLAESIRSQVIGNSTASTRRLGALLGRRENLKLAAN